MASSSHPSQLWLSRATSKTTPIDRSSSPIFIRTWTDGSIPNDQSPCEAIVDPFSGHNDDVWKQASTSPRIDDIALNRVGDVKLEVPCVPSKVIGVGRNYAAHAAELGNAPPKEPLLFFKPPSCLIAHQQSVYLPRGYARIDMEAELVVVIGPRARELPPEQAWKHVAGYTLGNDISCRDLQKSDPQWTRAKGFDGFGPVGPWIRMVPPGWELPGAELRIRGQINETMCQDACIADMIFSIPRIITYISACMTLNPGDLIYTGTPKGVHPLKPGDYSVVEIAGNNITLGQLSTPFV